MIDLSTRDWDLVVVGAGSAGATFAARCAEGGRDVLLLEAGPDYRSADVEPEWRALNPTPALLDAEMSASYVWPELLAARTASQDSLLYWRGRGVGGSSAINGIIAIRPPMDDYVDWVSSGCVGWGPSDVLPYFCRLEQDELFGDRSYHGDSGPIPIFRMPESEWGAVDRAFRDAALQLGHDWTDDINAPGATGVSTYPINARNYERVSTNDAYLEPARGLPNLTIVGDALVDRVLMDRKRAVGVRVRRRGEWIDVRAAEVVLSAGVIHSPAILIRSGIGPAARLLELGAVPCVDLPVGMSFQDHPAVFVSIRLREGNALSSPFERHTNVAALYTSAAPGAPANDMLMLAMNQRALAAEFADRSLAAGAVGVWLNRAYSRGELIIRSLDPDAQPFVNANMLSEPFDLSRLREGVRHLLDLSASSSIAGLSDMDIHAWNPQLSAALDDGSDRALDAAILTLAADTQHGTSTCRMGDSSASDTVVDSECRVLGTENLRVIDASIFPQTSRANTHLATVMVAEKMADELLRTAHR